MVKRILSICLIFIAGMTSLVASSLHQNKQTQPYVMYQESRQYESEIYYNTVEIELDDLEIHSRELKDLSLQTSLQEDDNPTFINGEMAVAGVSVVLTKAKVIEDTKEIKYKYEVTKEERKMLERIAEAEVTGGDIESKKNVISSILNRVESDSFPSTIEKVIYQKDQYSPISDGRFNSVEITEETKQAVEEVLLDGTTHDCLYFFNMKDVQSAKINRWIEKKLEFVFKDDVGHSFYKEK